MAEFSTPLPTFVPPAAFALSLSSASSAISHEGGAKPNRYSSSEFSEQIRLLEIEGGKLRASVAASLSEVIESPPSPESRNMSHLNRNEVNSAASLISLMTTSVSPDQKTISDLRLQLESQKKETDRLQSQLITDLTSSVTRSAPHAPPFSTPPVTELASSISSARKAFEYLPPSHLEKSLKDSQEQVADLRKRLVESNQISEEQRRQFRSNIEELKSKLHETVVNRDTVLELRKKESLSQEELLNKIQTSYHQLQDSSKSQELTILETNKKTECMQHSNFVYETALKQIRTVLSDIEKKRERSYFESEPILNQSPAMVAHTLERCIQDLDRELDMKKFKLQEVEADMKELQAMSAERLQHLMREHQEKFIQFTTENETQQLSVNERATNARKQAATLQAQLQLVEGHTEQQLKMKDELIQELGDKLQQTKEESSRDRKIWMDKRQALEQTLDSIQKEVTNISSERAEAIRQNAVMETKITEAQLVATRLESDLQVEKERNKQLSDKDDALRSKQAFLESKLEEHAKEAVRQDKMLELVKQECSLQVQSKVALVEKEERERSDSHLGNLSTQLNSITDKYTKASIDLEMGRAQVERCKDQIQSLSEKLEASKIQLTSALGEKHHVAGKLEDRTSNIKRLTEERDNYFNMLEKRTEELANIQCDRDKLSVQLEEKERNNVVLRQQSENISHMIEMSEKSSGNMRDEKDSVTKLLHDKTVALEELVRTRDIIGKKLKQREKRIREIEVGQQNLTEECQLKGQEVEVLKQEKSNLYKELKQSRYDVANLTEERDNLRRSLETQRNDLQKEITKLRSKLKGADQEINMAQKAINTKDSVDSKAVKVADKMQKEVTAKRGEVDRLRSKVRVMEEKMDTVAKERGTYESTCTKLKSTLSKTMHHDEQLSKELDELQRKNRRLKDHVSKLESALEKAAIKNASSKNQVEMSEQELARLKLKHQLDIKEIEKNTHLSTQMHAIESISANTTPSKSESEKISDSMKPATLKQENDNPYKEVGEEMKGLLREMHQMMAIQNSAAHYSVNDVPYPVNPLFTNKDNLRPSQTATPHNPSNHIQNPDDFSLSKSLTRLDDTYPAFSTVTDGFSVSQIPHTKHRRRHSGDLLDLSASLPNTNDVPHYATKLRTPAAFKQTGYAWSQVSGNSSVQPDSYDVFKRLEEKISNLSKMGGFLQQGNKDMANLIQVQGRKINNIKQKERNTRKGNH